MLNIPNDSGLSSSASGALDLEVVAEHLFDLNKPFGFALKSNKQKTTLSGQLWYHGPFTFCGMGADQRAIADTVL